MFTIPNYDTLIGQVTPHGVIVLLALYIESPLSEERLARLCRTNVRTLRANVLSRTELHNYTASTGLMCYGTDKSNAVIGQLIEAFATELRIQSPANADSDTRQPTQAHLVEPAEALPAPEAPAVCAPRAPAHSDHDQISDHDHVSDHDHDLELNEAQSAQHAQRDRDAVLDALLDHYGIRDLGPGREYRSSALLDSWLTPERLVAAMQLARERTDRSSPLGLAIHMLFKTARYRGEIEQRATNIKLPDLSDDATAETKSEDDDDRDSGRRHAWAEIRRIEDELQRAPFSERPALLKQREAAYQAYRQAH